MVREKHLHRPTCMVVPKFTDWSTKLGSGAIRTLADVCGVHVICEVDGEEYAEEYGLDGLDAL